MKQLVTLCCFLFVGYQIHSVSSHSWLVCTDYVEKNGAIYDPNKCRGFPRAANLMAPKKISIGRDTAYDHRPKEHMPCRTPRNDSQNYDIEHPPAVYFPGQQVVLAHPMKGHGADAACTRLFTQDNGNFIYSGPRNGGSDPTFSQFRENLIFDLGRSVYAASDPRSSIYPKPGYQNAPNFCSNKDKSLGTYSFNVPRSLQPGRYSFMWLWAFKNKNNLYSTCFEVDIVEDKEARNGKLKENGMSDFSEPCGGLTSNPNINGTCNPDVGGGMVVRASFLTLSLAASSLIWVSSNSS